MGTDGRETELRACKYSRKPCKPYHLHVQQILRRRSRKQRCCWTGWRRPQSICTGCSGQGCWEDGQTACCRCNDRGIHSVQTSEQIHRRDYAMGSCKRWSKERSSCNRSLQPGWGNLHRRISSEILYAAYNRAYSCTAQRKRENSWGDGAVWSLSFRKPRNRQTGDPFCETWPERGSWEGWEASSEERRAERRAEGRGRRGENRECDRYRGKAGDHFWWFWEAAVPGWWDHRLWGG